MRRGDFAAAWAANDAALAARDPRTRDDPALPYHLRWVWDGTPPDGRDVLVRCYHGLGDTLQFSRYLPALAAHARSLTVEVQLPLLPLLATMEPRASLVPFRPEAPLPPAACTMEIMEAGHALRTLPPPAWPKPPPPAPAHRTLRVGVCWAGGDWDRERSVPLADLLPVADVGGIAWTCLQQGADPAGRFGAMLPVSASVSDTARLMSALDAVLTVDTMMAHLAGTLGVPALVMLKADADWRWLSDRRSSPWYPSVRLYRQDTPGDWSPVVRAVAADLAMRAATLVQTSAGEELASAPDLPGAVPTQ